MSVQDSERASLRLGLDLDAAAVKVMKEVVTDAVPDVIDHADWHELWPERRADLEGGLADGTYRPRRPELVEVPKSTLAFRPIAVLDLADRILYQAIIDKIAEDVDSSLGPEVMSARVKRDKKGHLFQDNQVRAWVAYERRGRELYKSCTSPHLLTTDITSYFEYIDIERLINDLKVFFGNERVTLLDLLGQLLRRWTRNTALNGLPQGPSASSILGNFYLRSVDELLRKLSLRFIRFQDDINIFAEEEAVLRQALYRITPAVRLLKLNLASAKTKLYVGEAVLKRFEDARKDGIEYLMRASVGSARSDGFTATADRRQSEGNARQEVAGTELREMFDQAVGGAEIRDRDVRFSVSRLSQLNDDHAVDWILTNLSRVPYLAPILVPYLSRYMPERPEIEARVREFLLDRSLNVVEYVEMQLIPMLARAHDVADETYAMLWGIVEDGTRSILNREFAARAVARHMHGSRGVDLGLLTLAFNNATDARMKRALLIALKEARDADRRFLDDVGAGHPELAHTCRYLRKDPRLPDP